ncbi:MAG: glutamate 5-kinase [Candidatus Omnitrophica bacterium]|nr:glutamate 5-kinase [Candidatus Omnitrophota bacterium]
MKELTGDYKRLVIKIGTSIIKETRLINSIIREVEALIKRGSEPLIVSSGAIASGMSLFDQKRRPNKISHLQALASIGQNRLINIYQAGFKRLKIKCAQILLTWDDFSDRKRYLNTKNTLEILLKWKALPIINENDTVSTNEIRFGDNDQLSAMVATLINADILIIITDVDGLLDENGRVLRVVEEVTTQIKRLAGRPRYPQAMGGMETKLLACERAMEAQIPCVIVNGRKRDILLSAIKKPEEAGTLFLPKKERLRARQLWLAHIGKQKGRIFVDQGAKAALLCGKSLLCVGVKATEGNFHCGDLVEVVDNNGKGFGRGKVNFSALQLEQLKGKRQLREAIHRDNLVVL